MRHDLLLGCLIGIAAGQAAAAAPPYCGAALPAGRKPSPVCADATLSALEGDERKAYEAARGRLAGSPALAEALEQDEARFLSHRDAIIANLAKVDPYNRKEKEEFHDAASLMRKRIAFLARIDGAPRKTLRGYWGGADGYLSINDRERGLFVSLLAGRKQIGLDAVEDWLCRGMGETRGKPTPEAPRLSVTLYRGDGEGLPPHGVTVQTKDGMAEVTFQKAGKGRSRDGSPVCEGSGAVKPVRLLPIKEPN